MQQLLITFGGTHDFMVNQGTTENAGLLLGVVYYTQDVLLMGLFYDPNYLPIWIFSTCATPMTHCKPVTLPPARPAGPRRALLMRAFTWLSPKPAITPYSCTPSAGCSIYSSVT